MIPTLIIGSKRYASWSLRAWHNLKRRGISFNERLIRLTAEGHALSLDASTREQIRHQSPSGKVPSLHIDGVDVPESLAIMLRFSCGLDMTDSETIKVMSQAIEMASGFGALRQGLPLCIGDRAPAETALDSLPEGIQRDIRRLNEFALETHDIDFIRQSMLIPYALRLETYRIRQTGSSIEQRYQQILSCATLQDWRDAAQAEPKTIPGIHRYVADFPKAL